jgi:AcrR family transcriptional regulator
MPGEHASRSPPGELPKRRGRPPSGGREAILEAALELLRERGIARLTTREIARVAGVSEASIFYHYRDRAGLLMAVFEEGVRPLQARSEGGRFSGSDLSSLLSRVGPALEQFLDQALPVISAAQSDVELRDALVAYMSEQDLGPHRGVSALGAFLDQEQQAGRVRSDVDARAVALMFVGACFIRASQRQMPVHKVQLPPLQDVIAALDAMLRPAAS